MYPPARNDLLSRALAVLGLLLIAVCSVSIAVSVIGRERSFDQTEARNLVTELFHDGRNLTDESMPEDQEIEVIQYVNNEAGEWMHVRVPATKLVGLDAILDRKTSQDFVVQKVAAGESGAIRDATMESIPEWWRNLSDMPDPAGRMITCAGNVQIRLAYSPTTGEIYYRCHLPPSPSD